MYWCYFIIHPWGRAEQQHWSQQPEEHISTAVHLIKETEHSGTRSHVPRKSYFVFACAISDVKEISVCTKATLNSQTVCHTFYPCFFIFLYFYVRFCAYPVIVTMLSLLLSPLSTLVLHLSVSVLSDFVSSFLPRSVVSSRVVNSEACRTLDSAFYMYSISSMTEALCVCVWVGGLKGE